MWLGKRIKWRVFLISHKWILHLIPTRRVSTVSKCVQFLKVKVSKINVYNYSSQKTGTADLCGFEASLVYKASTFKKKKTKVRVIINRLPPVLVLAAHVTGTINIYFLQVWKLESPNTRCQEMQCLVRTCFLSSRRHSSHCTLTQ